MFEQGQAQGRKFLKYNDTLYKYSISCHSKFLTLYTILHIYHEYAQICHSRDQKSENIQGSSYLYICNKICTIYFCTLDTITETN